MLVTRFSLLSFFISVRGQLSRCQTLLWDFCPMRRERRGVIEVPTWFALQHVPCVFVAESLISGVEAVAWVCLYGPVR